MTKQEIYDMEILVNNMSNEDLKNVQKGMIAEMERLELLVKSLKNRIEKFQYDFISINFQEIPADDMVIITFEKIN